MSRILIIEDNLNNARMAAKLLEHAGHEVITAEDGEGGIMRLMECQPDAVLVDLGLPDIDGQTLVAMLRQQPDLEHMPIIAFTAWPEASAVEMARAYGCDGVIVKPIDTRGFAGQVAHYLRRRP
ncbi:MAG: response regulator [Chloroflexi bacterium]|nr:response regulator [Chloroflexota bacterium]